MDTPAGSSVSSNPPGTLVLETNADDVILGRGKSANNRPGNIKFRQLAAQNAAAYEGSNSGEEKTAIAQTLAAAIHAKGGRFLRSVTASNSNGDLVAAWEVVSEQTSLSKIKQAIRDVSSSRKKAAEQKAQKEGSKRKAVTSHQDDGGASPLQTHSLFLPWLHVDVVETNPIDTNTMASRDRMQGTAALDTLSRPGLPMGLRQQQFLASVPDSLIESQLRQFQQHHHQPYSSSMPLYHQNFSYPYQQPYPQTEPFQLPNLSSFRSGDTSSRLAAAARNPSLYDPPLRQDLVEQLIQEHRFREQQQLHDLLRSSPVHQQLRRPSDPIQSAPTQHSPRRETDDDRVSALLQQGEPSSTSQVGSAASSSSDARGVKRSSPPVASDNFTTRQRQRTETKATGAEQQSFTLHQVAAPGTHPYQQHPLLTPWGQQQHHRDMAITLASRRGDDSTLPSAGGKLGDSSRAAVAAAFHPPAGRVGTANSSTSSSSSSNSSGGVTMERKRPEEEDH